MDRTSTTSTPTYRPAESRQDRTTRNLVRLLQKRTDLSGVYAPADHLAETLRWSL